MRRRMRSASGAAQDSPARASALHHNEQPRKNQMRDPIETFCFIKKYHQDLNATFRGLRESKRIHELPESGRRDLIVSYRFAMIVLRDIGRFLLGIEQPQWD